MEFNEKKNNRGLIVVIILLIVLCLGLGGFIVYDKLLKEEPKKVEQSKEETEELIKGNTFKLSDIDCAKEETDKCVKQIELSYDNVNHDVKLIKKLIDNKYAIDVYIDNNLIDTLNGGLFYDWQDGDTAVDWLENLDGYIYVIDEKYLGLVYRVEGAKPSWFLKYYNDVKPFESDSDILVAYYGGSFGVDGKLSVFFAR